MFIDGSVVHYLLAQEFDDVTCDKEARRARVDFPILFDVSSNMDGHTVLVPNHERLHEGLGLKGSICVCLGEETARSARASGFMVIHVRDGVTFPQLYNFMQTAFVRLERLDAQLRAYVDTHAGAQPLLDACARVMGCEFALVDDRYHLIYETDGSNMGVYGADEPGPADEMDEASRLVRQRTTEPIWLDAETVDLFMASRNYQHMRLRRNVFTAPGSGDLLMKNIFTTDRPRGMLVSRHAGNPLSARFIRFVLNYLGKLIEDMFANMGSFGVIPGERSRMRAALAQLASNDTSNWESVQAMLNRDGHTPESSYVVLQFERSFTFETAADFEYLGRRMETFWPRSYCFVVHDALFMLADMNQQALTTGRDFLKDVLIMVRENLMKVGLSRPFATLDQLDAARTQASIALSQGSVTDPTFWFYRFDDYALPWLIEHGKGNIPAEYVAHPAVTILARYDEDHGSELIRTLSTFLRCRFNATKAAGELFVARSTLLNRLERIAELTGLNLDDVDDLVYLGLSLMLTQTVQQP